VWSAGEDVTTDALTSAKQLLRACKGLRRGLQNNTAIYFSTLEIY
jgi:hypothetical protein